MPWWDGVEVVGKDGKTKTKVDCLLNVFNDFVVPAERNPEKAMIMPTSGVYKIKGVGDVITGRVEQGEVEPNDQVKFLPTHTQSTECKGKVFTVEMHHKSQEKAGSGDNVGLNMKGLPKGNMPRVGDVMVLDTNNDVYTVSSFMAAVQILDHPGQLKEGYSPICF